MTARIISELGLSGQKKTTLTVGHRKTDSLKENEGIGVG